MNLFRKDISKLSDTELIAQYKKTMSNKFLGELYSRYVHLVFGVCLKYLKNQSDAKDMSQQVYEVIQKKLRTHEVNHFSGWLHQLTRNECLMELRRNKRILEVPLTEEQHLQEENYELTEKLILETKLEKVLAELENLKPPQRECMKLFYLKKMSYREITSSTNYTEKEVKSYIQNGKRNLKNKLLSHAEFQSEERNTRTA